MASLNNITLTPDSGTGTVQLEILAPANTGRDARSTKFTASNSTLGITSKSLVVTQDGKETFDVDSPIIEYNETSAVAEGNINLKTIKISSNDELWNYLSDNNTINGVTNITKAALVQGYSVPNDPGKTALYEVVFRFENIPENQSADDVVYTGHVNGTYTVTVTKYSSGIVINDIWFSNGQSSTSSTDQVLVTVNDAGVVTSGNPYINTIPNDLSWEIKSE